MEILRVKGKRTRVQGVRNNGVDIILVGETTKELKATLYCPRRDFAQKAKSRKGTLVTRAYIKESIYS